MPTTKSGPRRVNVRPHGTGTEVQVQSKPTERKYALTKIAAGDYLLPSNDMRTLWRIAIYTDGPSTGLEIASDRDFWGLWKWHEDVGPGSYVDTTDWNLWTFWAGGYETRAETIQEAMRNG